MSKHKKEEITITDNTAKNAEEEAGKARDPDNVSAPGQGGQSPETAAAGQPSEEAADTGTTVKNGDALPGEKESGEARPLGAEERIAGLEAKLAEANDQYLRKAADFENYRKRMNQEKQNAIDYANQTLFQDLILVIDDFERAIKSAESQREAAGGDGEQIAAGYNSLYEGITMIEKNLVSQLENKWGLKRFDSAGEPFDPNRHEAIMMEKSADIDEPIVAEDFIKGYILKDRVIRPAKVKVVMPENK